MRYDKAPFPYFGGKRHAARAVWSALGDPDIACDPSCGSLAIFLAAPHTRRDRIEIVGDIDPLLVNAWRAIIADPDGVADAASWIVSEAEVMARHIDLVAASPEIEAGLASAPDWCDVPRAGAWLYGIACWIGSGWCSGRGPWWVDNGRVVYRNGELGVEAQRTHVSNNGQGINHPSLREPGVERQHDFHPRVMPRLRDWMRHLSERLRNVVILHADWRDTCARALAELERRPGATLGVFLDPPYSHDVRKSGIYAYDDKAIAARMRAWALSVGDDPRVRVALAGFRGEGHERLERHGWRVVSWATTGYLRGGMARDKTRNAREERIWLSPHCVVDTPPTTQQYTLWED